ncbi:MAG TPA: hemerythrin domain-containing protein [Acidobacteriota bacterium]
MRSYFETDHHRLDNLFIEFQRLKYVDFNEAKKNFIAFKFGLQRHIIWEEEVLFPLFEEKTGMSNAGPTLVMRLEHKDIGTFLEQIHTKVKTGDPGSESEEKLLLCTLKLHNIKEENVLYPAIDQCLTEMEIEQLFEKIYSIPEERYQTCCSS